MSHTQAVTVQLTDSLYRRALDLARNRGISLAALVQEALGEKTREDTELDLAEAYEILAEDPDEADVEPFLAAQAEILEG